MELLFLLEEHFNPIRLVEHIGTLKKWMVWATHLTHLHDDFCSLIKDEWVS